MKLKKLISSAALMLFAGFLAAGCSNASGGDLKVLTQKNVELGEPVSLDASEYLLEQPSGAVLEEISVESDLKTDPAYSYNDFSRTVTSKGSDYLQAGTYKLDLKYKGQSYPVTLAVVDTTMPEFISPAAVVTIPVGTTSFDFSRVYRTKDMDKVTIKTEGDYDLDTVGTYPVTLIATDASGNTNSLEITVNVVGKNQQIKAADQFDDELVPSEEDSTYSEPVTEPSEPASEEPAVQPSTEPAPAPEENQPNEQPAPGSQPGGCSVSSLPAGSEIYYSFSDLYAAGTA